MDVTKSTLIFKYDKRLFEAQVLLYKPVDTWMLWVYVPSLKGVKKKNIKDFVFVYYNRKKGELFWYDLPDTWEQMMAKVIAGKLLED